MTRLALSLAPGLDTSPGCDTILSEHPLLSHTNLLVAELGEMGLQSHLQAFAVENLSAEIISCGRPRRSQLAIALLWLSVAKCPAVAPLQHNRQYSCQFRCP